ncbi:UDP-N-acetylmuramate--L-alanine ligase [Clostridium sp. SYSU_GA19001]|uniref:UDP-N-acetylmuramate--L-alanine ligase n=1 Tax=Clostridium caldaquaticum TaxID=2940653 RepID=UPI0020772A8A|nr:UDP-N-acetylmuramate--L-alanine ligase [Clostridium caldaquaticum]MCM8709588.1 UDP-N-acetylmuramate--L-alanine ligase [Clostridium caldaquaticum]
MSFDFIKDKHKKIHFIGIGGISMSGLAEILLENNYRVSGSDMKSSLLTEKLGKHGAEIFIGHASKNVEGSDLVVYTAAVSEDNPELIRAKELNIPTMDRAEFLGKIMKGHKYNVAISGTHGKTTTTSMVSHIFLNADLDPTILVGGELDIIDGNVKTGKSEYFITEACEYKASFLKFFPYIGVILNIEADHLDFYRNIDHIQDTFTEFVKLIPEDGYLIAYSEDEKLKKVIKSAKCNVLTYGINEGDIRAKNINFNDRGCAIFDVYKNEEKLFTANLNVPGKHNVLNGLASICVALSLNVDYKNIVEGLANFFGTHRRFEIKGVKNGVTVVDDYAHHPTEIKATLEAAKNYPHKKIYCVFQPHTYTRTLTLFDNFVHSFSNADEVILADIYAAREKFTKAVSSDMLGDKIRELGQNCKNFHGFEDIVSYLNTVLENGDLLLTVGAGDVYKIGEMYLAE